MKITTTGQFGNWLFHTASAIALYGKVDEIISCGCSLNQFVKSKDIFSRLTKINVEYNSFANMTGVIHHHLKSNWQSIDNLPSRDECRKLFAVPEFTRLDNVVHVRGGDYLTFFKKSADVITIGENWLIKFAEKFNCELHELNVVTDDVNFVKSFKLPVNVISGDAAYDWLLLANAKKLAMSPSTFSWWAGFLGRHDKVLMPIGVGPWDNGILDKDKHSAHSNLDLCWGEECKPVYIGEENVFSWV